MPRGCIGACQASQRSTRREALAGIVLRGSCCALVKRLDADCMGSNADPSETGGGIGTGVPLSILPAVPGGVTLAHQLHFELGDN